MLYDFQGFCILEAFVFVIPAQRNVCFLIRVLHSVVMFLYYVLHTVGLLVGHYEHAFCAILSMRYARFHSFRKPIRF